MQGIGSHLIDMSRFLVGDVSSVTSTVRTYVKERDSKKGKVCIGLDEGMLSLLEFSNGATGIYETLGVATGCNNRLAWEIYGSKGALKFDLEKPNILHVYQENNEEPKIIGFTEMSATQTSHPWMDIWWPKGHNLGWEHGHINLISHYLDCVFNNKEVAPYGATFEDGYYVAAIIDAITESSNTMQKVYITY
jgi:predicted dehydrogenase